MSTVYLKEEETLQVSMEDLEKYLYENYERIGTRRKKLHRLPIIDVRDNSTKKSN